MGCPLGRVAYGVERPFCQLKKSLERIDSVFTLTLLFRAVNDLSHSQNVSSTERLAAALEALGSDVAPVNQRAVADKAGVPRQVLSELLHGKRSLTPHYARLLAPVLGVPAGYLLGNEELPGGTAA